QQRLTDRQYEEQRRETDRLRQKRDEELQRQYQENQRRVEIQRAQKEKELEFLRSNRQRELQRVKAFSDELNKTRVQKIAEVWEKLSLYEVTLRRPVRKGLEASIAAIDWFGGAVRKEGREERKKEIEERKNDFESAYLEYRATLRAASSEFTNLLAKNRFWLGDEIYEGLDQYFSTLISYNDLGMLIGNPTLTRKLM